MTHPVSDELLSAYLDGELSPAEVVEVERQLEESTELRERLAEFSQLSKAFQSFTAIEAPADFRSSILEQLEGKTLVKREPPEKFSLAWWRPIIAVCVLVALGSLLLNRENNVAQHTADESAVVMSDSPGDFAEVAEEQVAADASGVAATNFANDPGAVAELAIPASEPSMQTRSMLADAPKAISQQSDADDTRVASIVIPEEVPLTHQLLKQKLIALERQPEYGDVLSIIDDSQETPVVVEFSVVDVMETVGKVNVLLKNNSAVRPLSPLPAANQTESKLTAIMLELDNEVEMAAFLNQLPALGAKVFLPGEDGPSTEMLVASDAPVIPAPPLPVRISDEETTQNFNFIVSKPRAFKQQVVQDAADAAALADRKVAERKETDGKPAAAGSPKPADEETPTQKTLRALLFLRGE